MSTSSSRTARRDAGIRTVVLGAAAAIVATMTVAPAPAWAVSESELKAALSVMSLTTGEAKATRPPARRAVTAERLRKADAAPQTDSAISLMRFHRISLKRLEAVLAEIAVVMPYVNLRQSISASEPRDMPQEERAALASYLEAAKSLAMKGFGKGADDFEKTAALLEKYSADVNQKIMPRLQPVPTREGGDR